MRSAACAGGLVAGAGYAWWATTLRPFTLPALAAVVAAGLAAMALGARLVPLGPTRRRLPGPPAAWAGSAAALGLWELASFLQHPRAQHPTVSSLANGLFESHAARTVGLLGWLAGAAALAQIVRPRPGRLPLLAAWLWLGWHLFVRAGYA